MALLYWSYFSCPCLQDTPIEDWNQTQRLTANLLKSVWNTMLNHTDLQNVKQFKATKLHLKRSPSSVQVENIQHMTILSLSQANLGSRCYCIHSSDKRGYHENFFLFLHENICCGYSSVARFLWVDLPTTCFRKEIRKYQPCLWKKVLIGALCICEVLQPHSHRCRQHRLLHSKHGRTKWQLSNA